MFLIKEDKDLYFSRLFLGFSVYRIIFLSCNSRNTSESSDDLLQKCTVKENMNDIDVFEDTKLIC